MGQKINLRKVVPSDAESIYQNAKDKDICLAVPLPIPYTLKSAQDYIKICQKKWKSKMKLKLELRIKILAKLLE